MDMDPKLDALLKAGQGTVVSAGEVNLTGPLTVQVTAAGKDCTSGITSR